MLRMYHCSHPPFHPFSIMTRATFAFTLIAFLLTGCVRDMSDPNGAAFVTLLGTDTLAVEQFHKSGNTVTAQVILRSPRTTFTSYELTLDDSGGIERMTQTEYPLSEGFRGEGTLVRTITRMDDSLIVEILSPDETRTVSAPYEPGVLPFIDMVHWPFELVLNNAVAAEQDTMSQPFLTGARISNFIVADVGTGTMTLRHPSRGVMDVEVNAAGNLLYLDASQTTRKVEVFRVPSIDMDDVGERFAASDAAGSPFGELSGAEVSEFSIGDTHFRVEYGVPLKRGRELFGGIVPWGERWRTGANRATHFYTSDDLRVGDLIVPAGEYTLFTIPEPDGGTLMINTQTGQNGQSYDESLDLGRVPMQISTKDDITEAFTITVEETEDGGTLNLIWGDTVFSVDFEIL